MLLTVAQIIKDLLPLCLRVQNIFAVGQPDRSLQYVQFCLEQSGHLNVTLGIVFAQE